MVLINLFMENIAFLTTANSTGSHVNYSYTISGNTKNGEAFLIFRDIANEYIELIIVERPWSREPIVLFEEIRFDEGHQYDNTPPHLKIDICKGEDNEAIKSLRKKSVIANEILGHRIELTAAQVKEIKSKRVPAIYGIVSEKIKKGSKLGYDICCVTIDKKP
jgi:hypothetical protein